MSNLFKAVIAFFALFASAHAEEISYITHFAAPPDAGQYWNPQEPGNGYGIDIDSKGNVFVQWFTYRADGVPVWYTMSGKIERAPEQMLVFAKVPACTNVPFLERCLGDKVRFFKTGVLARVTSPVYAVANGACPTCPPRFPDVSQSALGPATIEWVGNRAAVLTFQGRSVAIQRQDIATPMRDLVANKNFTGSSSRSIFQFGAPPAQISSLTARFVPATLITGVSSVAVNGVPTLNLSALNLNAPTTRLYAGTITYDIPVSVVGSDPEAEKVIVIDEKNNRAYLLFGTTPLGGFEFKVSSYGELFIYGDRMICWQRSANTNPALGISYGSNEWIFKPVLPGIELNTL